MTTPTTPPVRDLAEVIADQGRRTRRLLVWLLVGIPLLAGVIWGIVILVASHAASTSTDAPVPTYQAPMPPPVAPLTPITAVRHDPDALTSSSRCSDLLAEQDIKTAVAHVVGGTDAAHQRVGNLLITICWSNEQEPLGTALRDAQPAAAG